MSLFLRNGKAFLLQISNYSAKHAALPCIYYVIHLRMLRDRMSVSSPILGTSLNSNKYMALEEREMIDERKNRSSS